MDNVKLQQQLASELRGITQLAAYFSQVHSAFKINQEFF